MKAPDRRQAISSAGEQLHLIEPPPFSPTWLPRSTLAGRALAALLSKHRLKHPDFMGATGSWRLAEPIRKLPHDYGWPVDAFEILCPTTDNPSRNIGEYALPPWVVETVGGFHG